MYTYLHAYSSAVKRYDIHSRAIVNNKLSHVVCMQMYCTTIITTTNAHTHHRYR